MIHKSDIYHWPKKAYDVYSEENLKVVQSPITLKYWIAFKIGDANCIYWSLDFDLSTLSRVRHLRSKYYDMYYKMLDGIPDDILPER